MTQNTNNLNLSVLDDPNFFSKPPQMQFEALTQPVTSMDETFDLSQFDFELMDTESQIPDVPIEDFIRSVINDIQNGQFTLPSIKRAVDAHISSQMESILLIIKNPLHLYFGTIGGFVKQMQSFSIKAINFDHPVCNDGRQLVTWKYSSTQKKEMTYPAEFAYLFNILLSIFNIKILCLMEGPKIDDLVDLIKNSSSHFAVEYERLDERTPLIYKYFIEKTLPPELRCLPQNNVRDVKRQLSMEQDELFKYAENSPKVLKCPTHSKHLKSILRKLPKIISTASQLRVEIKDQKDMVLYVNNKEGTNLVSLEYPVCYLPIIKPVVLLWNIDLYIIVFQRLIISPFNEFKEQLESLK